MAAIATVSESLSETLPLEEQVRRRAYELYVRRGSEAGSELDDWFQAEQETLLAHQSRTEE